MMSSSASVRMHCALECAQRGAVAGLAWVARVAPIVVLRVRLVPNMRHLVEHRGPAPPWCSPTGATGYSDSQDAALTEAVERAEGATLRPPGDLRSRGGSCFGRTDARDGRQCRLLGQASQRGWRFDLLLAAGRREGRIGSRAAVVPGLCRRGFALDPGAVGHRARRQRAGQGWQQQRDRQRGCETAEETSHLAATIRAAEGAKPHPNG